MISILFVDDEQNLLEEVKNVFRKRAGEWRLEFAQSGAEALEIVDRTTIHIIVSDMQMPGMDGVSLLAKIQEKHPRITRFLLTGQADREAIVRAIPVVHQFIYKPCSASDLLALIDRTVALHERIQNEFVLRMISGATCVPSAPKVAMKIGQLLASGEATLRSISDLIERDPGLSTRVLQVANSAVFGRSRRIESIADAVSFIGFECAQSLAIASEVFQTGAENRSISLLLEITVEKAYVGATLASKFLSGHPDRGIAMTAALLRDVGLLVSASASSLIYQVAMGSGNGIESLIETEKTCFGATHAEIGGHLLALWGIPMVTVELVTCHHSPGEVTVDPVLAAAVHVADVMASNLDLDRQELSDKVDWEFIERHRLEHMVNEWLDIDYQSMKAAA